jgi:hypothetical protein
MQREETELTLDEEGLDAVKGFLQNIVRGKIDKPDEEANPDIWEPPIDNECD